MHPPIVRRRLAVLPLSILLAAALTRDARADATPDQIAAARALGRAGLAEAEAGDCVAAVAKLTRAESLYHAPTTAEPLGECQITLGKLVEGTEVLNRLVHEQLSGAAPAAFVAAQERARDVLAQATPKIARLRVHVWVPPGAGDPAVTIDGEPLNPALFDNDRPTDPGLRVVRASASGCAAAEKSVELAAGDAQSISLTLVSIAKPADVAASPSTPATIDAPEPSTEPQPDAPRRARGARTHDGFYFRAGLGAALFAAGSVTPPGGPDVSVSGAGPSLELAFGGTPFRGLVIGGGIYGMTAPSPSYSAGGATLSGGSAVVSSIGPFADWYPDPQGGLHVEAALGLAVIEAGQGTTFPPSDQSGTGFSLLGGVGYEWWIGDQVSVGALARLQFVTGSVKGSGDTDSTSVTLVVPALLGTLTYQ